MSAADAPSQSLDFAHARETASATVDPWPALAPVTHLDKSDVLDGLFAEWDAIDALVDGLSEPQWQAQTPLPGWNVHDVVAHMIGTESMLQGAATPEADIDVSTLKHVRNDIGVLNERWVRRLRGDSSADCSTSSARRPAERRKALADMSDDDWSQITATPAGPDTYGRFMRVRDLRLLDARARHPRCARTDRPTTPI